MAHGHSITTQFPTALEVLTNPIDPQRPATIAVPHRVTNMELQVEALLAAQAAALAAHAAEIASMQKAHEAKSAQYCCDNAKLTLVLDALLA